MTAQKRVNARLPNDVARQLELLERMHGLSTTDVLLESIRRFFRASMSERTDAAALLAREGFIGVADGPRALSSTYKAELGRSLAKKS